MCARNCPVHAIVKTDVFGKNPRLNAIKLFQMNVLNVELVTQCVQELGCL